MRGLAAVGLLALAGCGFKPLYGDVAGSVPVAALQSVEIGLIEDRTGQQMRNQLLARIGDPQPGVETRYLMDVELRQSTIGLAVARDSTATRVNLTLIADVVVTRLEDGEIALLRTLYAYSSYNVLAEEFATSSAERDAQARASRELADRIINELGLFLQRERAQTTTAAN